MSDLLKDIESYYTDVYKTMNQKTQEYYFGQDNVPTVFVFTLRGEAN